MSRPALSRRRIVAGLAIVPAATLPALAVTPRGDVPLLSLAAAFHAAQKEYDAALAEWRGIYARYQEGLPPRPDALRRKGDFRFFFGMSSNPHSPDFYLSGEVASYFRGYEPMEGTVCPIQRKREADRARKIVEAQDTWAAACERHAERIGYAEIERRCDEIADRRDEIGERIRSTPATSVEGVIAKARVAQALEWDGFEGEVLRELIEVAGGQA